MPKEPIELSIGNIFSPEDASQLDKYVIPRYQRNYAWTEPHIKQLIQDILDFSEIGTKNYYLGSLVVYEREEKDNIFYETIDGQQRLTTLNILFSVLKNEFNKVETNFKINLKFDSRPKSSKSLEYFFNYNKEIDVIDHKEGLNTRIKAAYNIITKELRAVQKNESDEKLDTFVNYLKTSVKLLRVPVPKDTNLNHYFEIMNSRGEQLEKHEVLKAQMLKVFAEESKNTLVFNTIWEACANMEKYVQYGFSTYKNKQEKESDRDRVFGTDWTGFNPINFVEVVNCLSNIDSNSNYTSMVSIIENIKGDIAKNKDNKEGQERFTTIINFSNFLLHVLRVLVNQSNKYIIVRETEDEIKRAEEIKKLRDVPLDDKRLIDTFNLFLENEKIDKKAFVEDFGYYLLKLKNKYDKYVIKRDGIDDKWSLKQLEVEYYSKNASHKYNNTLPNHNPKIIHLLSMFHVSAPTLIYKHWLNAVLNFVSDKDVLIEVDYINYLENLSDAYLYDNFLANKDQRIDYYHIIYTNNGKRSLFRHTDSAIDGILNNGTSVENFIFNRLDYLLYYQWESQKNDIPEEDRDYKFFNSSISNFSFSSRSSVEHYYPQNPHNIDDKLDNKDYKFLNNFGNLCLISGSQNSKLSNLLPEGKKSHYSPNDIESESVKQRLMMSYNEWDKANIEHKVTDHYKKMKELLLTTNQNPTTNN
jgi:hypothetical protein